MLKPIRHLLEMIRFSHTVVALRFALLGAVLAWVTRGRELLSDGEASGWQAFLSGFAWVEVIGILVCMVTARSASMALKRLADRQIDAGNPRTAGRHLPTGTRRLPITSYLQYSSRSRPLRVSPERSKRRDLTPSHFLR